MKKFIAAAMTAASILSVAPVHAKTPDHLHVSTTEGARVTITCGKKKTTKIAKNGDVEFQVKKLDNVKVKIEKKGFVTWQDTYITANFDSDRVEGGAESYCKGPNSYSSVGSTTVDGNFYKDAYVNQPLVKCNTKSRLAGRVDIAFNMPYGSINKLNATIKASDGKHTYKTKLKQGEFDFGKVSAGYYTISGKGKYKGRKITFSGRKSSPSTLAKITAYSNDDSFGNGSPFVRC